MTVSDPVVVTGLGSVLAGGSGAAALERSLGREPETVEVDRDEGYHPAGAPRRFLPARQVDLSPWLSPRAARRMSLPSKLAAAAARMATEEAGVDPDLLGEETTSVVVATAFGTARFAELLIRDILTEGPEAASPFYFSESVANAPAAQVSIAAGARGAQVAVTQQEAGPLMALILGAREVRRGRARFALAGTTEEINPLVHSILARFRALAGGHGREERSRPFDRRRTGFLAAEGSVVLVLEPESRARNRDAPILARVAAWERGFDPTAPSHGWGRDPDGLANRLREGLARQRISVGSIDRVVSSASGSAPGDRLEGKFLRALFGDSMPPVLAPKGAVGEYGGGHLGAAILAARGLVFPTLGFEEPDPELELEPHDGSDLPAPDRTLVSALSSGGAAAWVVLERP